MILGAILFYTLDGKHEKIILGQNCDSKKPSSPLIALNKAGLFEIILFRHTPGHLGHVRVLSWLRRNDRRLLPV